MLARSLLFITPRAGCREAIIDTFARIDVPGHALEQDGCLSVELLAPSEPDAPLVVTALWEDRDAYDGWLANPWRAESTAALEGLVEGEMRGEVRDVRIAASRAGAATTSAPERS
jgi:quinol monooxygenase YgiN